MKVKQYNGKEKKDKQLIYTENRRLSKKNLSRKTQDDPYASERLAAAVVLLTSHVNFTPVSVNTCKNVNESSEKVMKVKTNQT